MYEHLIFWIICGLLGVCVIILLLVLCLVCNRCLLWNPRNYQIIKQVDPKSLGSVEMDRLKSKVETLRRELDEERAEKEIALNRLSSIVSSRIRDGNPNVLDLSDQNRPGKLGEQYSELYDNEWTDAYNAIDKTKRFSSEQIIDILLNILLNCFEMCKAEADHQMVKIRHELETIIVSVAKDSKTAVDDMLFTIKGERKLYAAGQIPDYQSVKQMLMNVGVVDEAVLNIESVLMFTKACARLCWFMVVQDPPMTLLFRPNGNADECFRPYLTRGKQLSYVVWPTLLLHEKGPLVFKGIAEFRKD